MSTGDKNWWAEATETEKKKAMSFGKDYMQFLNTCKTERETVDYVLDLCEKQGFINLDTLDRRQKGQLAAGAKVYQNIHGKSILLAVVGNQPATNGLNILGAHIDAPRIDFKQRPFYEDTDFAMAKTHYYGGIKKYQWVCIPLALHGVVILKSGEKVTINVGEKPGDPCFVITDLLPHLATEQMAKKLAEGISGEGLNVTLGSIPQKGDKKDKNLFKNNLLQILEETYGITEDDFVSAEIEVVPAFPARDVGFDRGLIGAYGHDDRICAYAALRAIFDLQDTPTRTVCVYLSDKEEVGSMGNTGAQSRALENFLALLCQYTDAENSELSLRFALANSALLSADVAAAADPNYKDVQDHYNANYLGRGMVVEKYTGSRGKVGGSDANPEFIASVRAILDEGKVYWQTGELGKVDLGGGGTIAQYMANTGMQVIDCGVPILSMHAPFELASKADLYNAYRGYYAFLLNYLR